MKTLILMRHAKSDWNTNQADFDRPLNSRGWRNAKAMGQWLKAQPWQPQKVLCSSAVRTRHTQQIVLNAAELSSVPVEFDDALYEASVSTLKKQTESALSQTGCLLVVGHNPSMDGLLEHYTPDVPLSQNGKLMTTASMAVILFEADWSQLLTLQRPKELT